MAERAVQTSPAATAEIAGHCAPDIDIISLLLHDHNALLRVVGLECRMGGQGPADGTMRLQTREHHGAAGSMGAAWPVLVQQPRSQQLGGA